MIFDGVLAMGRMIILNILLHFLQRQECSGIAEGGFRTANPRLPEGGRLHSCCYALIAEYIPFRHFYYVTKVLVEIFK